MAQRELNILIKAKDEASKTVGGIEDKVKKLQPTFRKMAGVGTVALGAITGAVGKSISEFAKFEQAEVAFESMLGSAEEAKNMIEELAEFSAKTPFQFEDIVDATRTLVAFGDTGEGAREKLSFLGDIASGAQVPLGDIAQIFGKIQTKGKAMTEEILQMSERGIPVIDALAEQFGVGKEAIFEMASQGEISADVVEEALRSMTGEGGIFKDQMEKQSKTVSGMMSTLRDNVSLAMRGVGEAFSDNAGQIIEKVTEITGKIREWVEENPELTRRIIIVSGVIAGLVTVVGLLGMVLPFIITGFTLLAGPVGLVMLAIGLLVAIGKQLYDNWDLIANHPIVQRVWGIIKEAVNIAKEAFVKLWDSIKGLWEVIKGPVMMILKVLGAFLAGALFVGIMGVIGVITILVFTIKIAIKILTIIFKTIRDYFLMVWETLKIIIEAWKLTFQELGEWFNGLWTSISEWAINAWEGVKQFFSNSVQWFMDIGNKIGDFFKGIFESVGETIRSAFKAAVNWVINGINGLINKVNSISSKLNSVPGVNIPMIPNIPKLAKGGIVNSPTLAMIGEDGAEAVVPLNKKNNPMYGEGGGLTINIYGDVSGQDIVDKVGEKIMGQMRLNGQMYI